MSNIESTSFDIIVHKVHDLYDSLGKSGKPKPDEEWTCLASFVKECDSSFSVVSLATGTKCIGGNTMAIDGTVVNDSHAEVLARRNLLRYLYDQLEKAVQNNHPSVFMKNDKKFILKPGVRFHFYSSQVPCGDASIIPFETFNDNGPLAHKRKHTEGDLPSGKKIKIDVHRTGAKPVKTDHRQDPKGGGTEYHVRGAVRIKPGRGDPTKSLSCSDKIAKWLYCGVEVGSGPTYNKKEGRLGFLCSIPEYWRLTCCAHFTKRCGALLSSLLQDRITLSSIIIGGAGPFDATILKEALVVRSGLGKSPVFWRSGEVFKHSFGVTNASRPCSASINWADVTSKKLEISVEGRRLGVTKKSKVKSHLLTSKLGLFQKYLQLVDDPQVKGMTYGAAKETATEYQARKARFIQAMGSWSEDKFSYEKFSLPSSTEGTFI